VNTDVIRTYGDPVLNSRAAAVTEIDAKIAALVERMTEAMYAAPGVGLAANQIGVQRRLFVYDVGDGPVVVINPELVESQGEFVYEEGCLSVPGLSWEITRPDAVHLIGLDLDGNEISIETDEFEGRVLQHELDHLDGILLIEHLDDDQRRAAKKLLRERAVDLTRADPDGLGRLTSA
jgi:peptide deformylase